MTPRRLRDEWDRLDREAIRRMQGRRLHRFLRSVVVPFSPRYRALFAERGLDPDDFRDPDDLRRLPLASKADLLPTPENPGRARDYLLLPDRSVLARRSGVILRTLLRGPRRVREALEREYRPVLLTSTTGRSAEPTPFLYTRHDLDLLALAGRRLIAVAGATAEDRFVNLFPFAPHLAFWLAHYATSTGGVFCVSTGGGKTMGTLRNLQLMERLKPRGLIGMPTFLYHLLLQGAAEGRRFGELRLLVLGGEKVPEGMRRKLRDLAADLGSPGVRVVSTYGFTEARTAWAECPVGPDDDPTGFHLYPDLGIVEVVDPGTGEPVEDGTPGEVVHTPLDGRGTVVLRYRTGDLVAGGITREPCPACGRRVPRLLGRISRRSGVREMRLGKVKGTLVDFNELEHVLDDAEHVGAWQLELRKRNDDPLDVDRVVLHAHRLGAIGEEALREELNRRFALRTELRLNEIRFHSAAEMRKLQGVGKALKEIRVVDRRGKAGGSGEDREEAAAEAPAEGTDRA